MKKALIVHQSIKGNTRKYGEEIGKFLREQGLESKVIAIEDYKADDLQHISYLFLGCWTSGLFLFFQHPDKAWIKVVSSITIPEGLKLGLFTTYILATGTMFKSMKKHISAPTDGFIPELKSKNGFLSESDKNNLIRFIAD